MVITYGAEASKAFVCYECMDRVKATDNDIDSQVKLEAVDKKRVVNVSLHCHFA